jgi:hypothetical protein
MELKRSEDVPLLTLLRSLSQQEERSRRTQRVGIRGMRGEGSSSSQGEGNSSILGDVNQRPVVMVWDGMLPGEQESAKKIIIDEDDWIICRVKPPRDDSGGRVGTDRQSQEITDFLERHGTRLEEIKSKGTKTQRTSENVSRGGSTRRKGWYRTNDIRTMACCRDMEKELLSGEYRGDMGDVT